MSCDEATLHSVDLIQLRCSTRAIHSSCSAFTELSASLALKTPDIVRQCLQPSVPDTDVSLLFLPPAPPLLTRDLMHQHSAILGVLISTVIAYEQVASQALASTILVQFTHLTGRFHGPLGQELPQLGSATPFQGLRTPFTLHPTRYVSTQPSGRNGTNCLP